MSRIKLVRELEQIMGLLPETPHMASVRLKSVLIQLQVKPSLLNRIKYWLGI